MRTLTIQNSDTDLFVSIYPNEGRETVILLHGGPGVPDDLTPVAELLSDHFQVIGFHQRGTRLSPCRTNDYSIERYLTDIDIVANHFSLSRFHLFGHSWGGLYAQIYAQYAPKNILSLFLCSPSSGTGYQWKETENEVLNFNRSKCAFFEFLELGFNNLLGMMGNDKGYQRLFKQVIKNYNKGFIVKETFAFDFHNVRTAPINLTRKELLKYPILKNGPFTGFKTTVAYGDADIYGESVKYVRERFPTGSFLTIENCGHLPWAHNPKMFKSILMKHYQN